MDANQINTGPYCKIDLPTIQAEQVQRYAWKCPFCDCENETDLGEVFCKKCLENVNVIKTEGK